jgi:polyisoprenoid-binding protein YceI
VKTSVLILMLVLTLSACAGQPAAQPVPSPPVPERTASLPTATLPGVSATPTLAGDGDVGERVTFKIAPGESRVTYEVGETFLNQNNRFNLAVGVTSTISGEIKADLANPPASSLGEISVDISQFKSDNSRRDSAIRGEWLESSRFPLAVLKVTQIEGLPVAYEEGQDYSFQVTGDLTVKETTRPVTFEVTARLTGDTLTGRAVTTILLSDFGVGPISILGVLKTEDEARVTLDFVARP